MQPSVARGSGHAGTMPTAMLEHVFVTGDISATFQQPGDVQVQMSTIHFISC